MPTKSLTYIEELNNEDLALINKIDVNFVDKLNHFAWGVMGYWYDKDISWHLEVEEAWEIPSKDNKRADNMCIRRALKEVWGIKPRKMKWLTPYPQKWDDCFDLISSKKHYFFYSEVLRDRYDGQYYNGILSVRVEYDMLKNMFRLIRNIYISGDPEDIRREFIKYIEEVKLPVNSIKVDFMEDTNG